MEGRSLNRGIVSNPRPYSGLMRKVLLSAFEPFGGQSSNASQEVVRCLRNLHFENACVEVVELPVERFRAPELLLRAFARAAPDIVIMLGEAGGRAHITPERIAINVDDFSIPDNAGNQPCEEAVLEASPAAYFSTLPVLAIQNALRERDIPAAVSNSAGTFVCNHLFYRVLHHLTESGSSIQAGFIHIPRLPEQNIAPTKDVPSMPLETMLRGVQVAVETCVAHRGW